MNRVAIYRFLERGCNRLNPIRMSRAFLRYFILGGIGFGIIVFGLRIIGVRQANLGLWELLTFSGGLAGLILALRCRLGLIDAAYWLDDHLHTGEAFAAAVICLERNCSGMLDPLVVERAGKIAEDNPEIRWPLQNLFRPLTTALGLQLVFILIFMVAAPKLSLHLVAKDTPDQNHSPVIHRSSHQKTKPKIPGLPPRTVAEQLFPNDARLAARLENALKTGNTEAIERLLGQAERDSSAAVGDDIPVTKQKALEAAKDYQRIAKEMEQNYRGGPPDGPENGTRRGSTRNSGNNAADQESQMTQAMRKNQQNGRNGLKNSGSQNGQDRDGIGSNGNDSPNDPRNPGTDSSGATQRGGNKPGDGRGNKDSRLGTVLPDGSGRKVTFQSKGTTLEFVLPGKGAKIPLTRMVPAYRQANEAAMHRQGIPGEYRDYVRSYFKELSKETRLDAGNSENSTVTKEEPK